MSNISEALKDAYLEGETRANRVADARIAALQTEIRRLTEEAGRLRERWTNSFAVDGHTYRRTVDEADALGAALRRDEAENARLTEEVANYEQRLKALSAHHKRAVEGGVHLGTELIKAQADNARLLAERAPRPVPEGECPRHYHVIKSAIPPDSDRYTAYAQNMPETWPTRERATSVCIAHRNAVAADAFPEFAARIEALEADNADLGRLVAQLKRDADNPVWKKIEALAQRVVDTAPQSAPPREHDKPIVGDVIDSESELPPGLKWHREDEDGGWDTVFIDDERDTDLAERPYYYAEGDTREECLRAAWTRAHCERRLYGEAAATRELRAERDRLLARVDALDVAARALPLGRAWRGGGLHDASMSNAAQAAVRYMRGERGEFDGIVPPAPTLDTSGPQEPIACEHPGSMRITTLSGPGSFTCVACGYQRKRGTTEGT